VARRKRATSRCSGGRVKFFAAFENGDTDGLARLLAEDVTLYGDGGGKAPAVRAPVRGAKAVAQFLAGIGRHLRADQVSVDLVEVNGQPGAVVHDPTGSIIAVTSIDVAEATCRAYGPW
jgi:RNA polymerase sigma-70 factor (ECF subfamily)